MCLLHSVRLSFVTVDKVQVLLYNQNQVLKQHLSIIVYEMYLVLSCLHTCENNTVSGIITPHVYELNYVTEPQTGMPTKYDTRLKTLHEYLRRIKINEIPLENLC